MWIKGNIYHSAFVSHAPCKNTFIGILVTSQAPSKPVTVKTVWINQIAM